MFLVFVLVPLYWVVITSIKPSDDYLAVPPVWFPAHPTLVHYTAALFAYRGLNGLLNSLIVASATTVLSAILGTCMGYSFVRFNTGGKHLALWVLSQRFLPPIAIVLPLFLLYRGYGLYDTRSGLVLAYTVMTLPLSVWMMYAYFRQVPRALEEAALVDGCGWWQAFWKIAVPLALPGIVAAAVFAFIAVWTEFFFALILTSRNAFTLPTVFRSFRRLPRRAIWRIQRIGRHVAGAVDRARHAGAAASGAGSDTGSSPGMTPDITLRLYGAPRPPATQPRVVTAGRLSFTQDGLSLRWISYDGVELLRSIAFVVRDADWGTYAPAVQAKVLEHRNGVIRLLLSANIDSGTARLSCRITIEAMETILTATAEATAIGDFVTNRTGFVVLHPATCAGESTRIEHVDGKTTDGVFPKLISPHQPFMAMQTITHQPSLGITVQTRFEGDVFEMEDQRNWSDASFKTYSRPLSLPFPVTIPERRNRPAERRCAGQCR